MKVGSFGSKRKWKRRRRKSEDGSEKKRRLCWGGEAKARWPHARGDAHLSSNNWIRDNKIVEFVEHLTSSVVYVSSYLAK